MSQTKLNEESKVEAVTVEQKAEEVVGEKIEQKHVQISEQQETELHIALSEEAFEAEEEQQSEVESSSSSDEVSTAEECEEEAYYGEEEELLKSSESDEDKFAAHVQHLKRKKIKKMKKDFFRELQKMPDINKLKIDESIISLPIEDTRVVADFDAEIKDEEEESEEFTTEEESITESTQFSDFEFEFYSSEEERSAVVEGKVSDANLFEAFVRKDANVEIVVEQPDLDEMERLHLERLIRMDTQEFLAQLIELVVEAAEYVDPNVVLRENLSKLRLFRELTEMLRAVYVENKVNEVANKRCVDYYRRQKKFRPIKPDASDTLEYELKRFDEAILLLDYQLGRKAAVEDINKNQIDEAAAEVARMEKKLKREIADWTSFVKKTFANRGSERFHHFVEARLSEMAKLRSDISKLRQVFIRVQHDKGALLVKMNEIDTIDVGIHLHDYEALINEVFIIEKKMEERSNDLARQRNHFEVQIVTMAHMREKETIVYHAMKTQKEALYRAMEHKDSLRGRIHRLKLKRVRVKRQIQELSFKCGLIGKPALCLDFCATEDRCNEMKQKNGELEAKMYKLQERLNNCERKYAG